MTNKQFYSWRVIYPNGEIYYRKGIKLKALKSPFKFDLVPLEKYLNRYTVNIDEGQELVYFRRVKGHITIGAGGDIDQIKYCIGKKIGDYTSVIWINAETGKLQVQSGKNIKL